MSKLVRVHRKQTPVIHTCVLLDFPGWACREKESLGKTMCDAWRGEGGKANTFEVAHLTSPPASFPFRSFGGRREQQCQSMPVTDTRS